MDCNEALDLLYLSYEGQITPSQQVALNAHRRTCFACAAKLVKAEKFQQLIRRVPQVTVPRGLEDRILAHVSANAVIAAAPRPRIQWALPRFSLPKLQLNLGGVLAMGGVLAAAVAIFALVNTIIGNLAPSTSGTVTALVQGQLEATGPSGQAVLTGSQAITSGETLSNMSARPATVAFSPNLSVRLSPSTKVALGGVLFDKATNQVTIGSLRVQNGTVQIRENLHRDAAPIHVATRLATFIPTGTIFTVAQERTLSYLSVTKGMVMVYGPHKRFVVGPGRSLRILSNGGVLWDKLATKP